MDAETILALMAAQRHDFANHLQVISGLIQLHQEQRARDYIDQVARTYRDLGKVGQLKLPELAVVLFAAQHQATDVQMEICYDVRTDLDACRVPDTLMAQLLNGFIRLFVMGDTPVAEQLPRLKVEILDASGGYLCRLRLQNIKPGTLALAPAVFDRARAELLPYGGGLDWRISGDQLVVAIFLTRLD